MPQSFAFVFPGQGSQHLGMLAELGLQQPIVLVTFQQASSALAYDLWALVQHGPQERLDQTQFTQPALLTADVAIFRCWEALGGPKPQVMAGHSLGEYAALVCAGALKFEEAVKLVEKRGQYMQEAVPVGEGAMGAIIGLNEAEIESICENAALGQVVQPANLNSTGQTVISGHSEAVDRALNMAKTEGAKIAKRIPVSVPSHCPLMQPAADRLAQDIAKISIDSPKVPVIHNVDVVDHNEANIIRGALIKQLVRPVRWVETIKYIEEQGIKVFMECGPDNKLAGLIKRIDRQSEILPLTTTELILTAIKRLTH
ncbi:ACP S-malonyltransferase [Coxiella burnetii]|uniref:ACP S-malonyltransferase n=1 Tax=Coxiella burnetii TaxID=777 RepID=UPI0005934893|nr:ACP S-malonyltransferase [Coxiella burnetii]ATN73966.1 malonyl CoA-ACP transacylase [Coxiella burnetii]ATN75872.1 malonyl CoA-ACP transacylase [Coxiella burnetii]ATN77786.1 malonyl CoA-ACP transacylase [Coxiella burnetii]ATN79701.1 malonyl CoA-ACP transacylase [Coxiella burnetii]OYK92095.1 [acyl-carrier-protein] S-malonyltransferase [Coxiella burnetii]